MDKSLSPTEIDRLFIEGDRNLHRGNFSTAINIFEQLLEVIEPSHNQYFNIQRNLVKAYQKQEQNEKAIALCQLMIDSNSNIANLWGTKFMANLVPKIEQEVINKPNEQKMTSSSPHSYTSHSIKSKT